MPWNSLTLGVALKFPTNWGDIETDIEELGEKLSVRFQEFCKEYGRELA